MTTFLFSNNSGSTLSGAITNTATSLSLAAGGGALFPNPTSGQLFIITAIDAATGILREIMHCTARATDTLTVVRAQEGTTALNWNSGDLIQALVTAGMMGQFIQQGANPTTNIFFGGTDTGSVNAIVTTVTPAVGALADGMVFEIQPAHTNTSTTVTMNISALGPLTCLRADGTALRIGDLTAAGRALFSYDVTANAFYLMTPNIWTSTPQKTVLTSGSGTYTTPVGAAYLAIEMIGGGSGGGGAGTTTTGGAGGAGGATTFGSSLLTANGGPATPTSSVTTYPTPATATGSTDIVSGGLGSGSQLLQNLNGSGVTASGGNGASSPYGAGGPGGTSSAGSSLVLPGSAVAQGSGGGGGAVSASVTTAFTGWGGNAGAFLRAIITAPVATYAYAVGAAGVAGTAGTSGSAGSAGAAGLIRIVAYFQ